MIVGSMNQPGYPCLVAASDAAAFLLADLDVLENLFVSALFADGAVPVGEVLRGTGLDLLRALDDEGEEFVVDVGVHDETRTGAALLTLEAEGGGDDLLGGEFEIGVIVDEDSVLAAHFEHRALQPELAGMHHGGALEDALADFHRAGEGDEAGQRVIDDGVTDGAAGAWQEVDDTRGQAGFFEDFHETVGDHGGNRRGLQQDGVAGDEGGGGHADHDGAREIPRRNDDADAEGNVVEIVFFAGIIDDGLTLVQAHHLAAIEFEEVDGFGGVAVGFHPVLADFHHHRGTELVLASAQNGGGPDEDAGAGIGIDELPCLECFVGTSTALRASSCVPLPT